MWGKELGVPSSRRKERGGREEEHEQTKKGRIEMDLPEEDRNRDIGRGWVDE